MTKEKRCVPILSRDELTVDPKIKMKQIFINFITANYSQSHLYYGNITSLKALKNQYRDNIELLASKVQTALTDMYGRYYTKVEVEVGYHNDDTTNGKNFLKIEITAVDADGNTVSLTDSVES